jgi:methyl-accepting chemotaxis protein
MEETRASMTTVASLGGVARNIEKIVDAIALVTLQTAMLAVSGAVEAARAGDSGRGFAIVSNDIRSLAREATTNVERAKETVRGVLDQIAVLRNELDQIASSGVAEVQNNRAVTGLLEKMEADVAAMSRGSAVIVEGATTILRATSEAAKGARQVASAAEQASAASRQAATAATEQARAAEDLAGAIEEIASLADELKRHDG